MFLGRITYEGQLNEKNQPHGLGEWFDTMGENLFGYWEDGVPVGPFRSREAGMLRSCGFCRPHELIAPFHCLTYKPFLYL